LVLGVDHSTNGRGVHMGQSGHLFRHFLQSNNKLTAQELICEKLTAVDVKHFCGVFFDFWFGIGMKINND
jgi:hypothetical protein